jgi:hypothetical protein
VLRIGLDALCERTSLPLPRNRNRFARFSGTDGSPVNMLTGLPQPFTSEFSLDYLNIPLYFKIHFVPCISVDPSSFFRVLNTSHSSIPFSTLVSILIVVYFFLCFFHLYISLPFLSMILKIAKNIHNREEKNSRRFCNH